MKTICAVLAVLTLGGAATALAAPDALAARGKIRECGDVDRGVGIKNLTTRNVSCKRGRRVARRHPRDLTPFGYRCRAREIAEYTHDIRCRKGARVVHWQYVSD